MGMGRNHRDTVAQSQDIGASADAQGKIWDGVESVPTARWVVRNYVGKITDFYAFFRGSPRFYAQNWAVNPRCLASQARREMGAPVELFAGAKRGRIVTGRTHFGRELHE